MPERTWGSGDSVPATDYQADLQAQVTIICTSTTRGSTWLGKHIFETDTGRHLYYNGSQWALWTHRTMAQTGITIATGPGIVAAEVDINDSALTFAAAANTSYEMHWNFAFQSTEADDAWHFRSYRGSTMLWQVDKVTPGWATVYEPYDFWLRDTPGAGSVTYKMTVERFVGSGIGWIPTSASYCTAKELAGS